MILNTLISFLFDKFCNKTVQDKGHSGPKQPIADLHNTINHPKVQQCMNSYILHVQISLERANVNSRMIYQESRIFQVCNTVPLLRARD